jgi:hypothetical protein
LLLHGLVPSYRTLRNARLSGIERGPTILIYKSDIPLNESPVRLFLNKYLSV